MADHDALPPDVRRVIVQIRLQIGSAVHVGANIEPPPRRVGNENTTLIHQIARDHDGRPHIPGTGLAGALRDVLRRRVGEERCSQLFGESAGSANLTSSALVVDEGVIAGAEATRDRTRVVIHRHTKSASPHLLFTKEEVHKASDVTFRLELHSPTPEQETLLKELLAQLRTDGGLVVGAGANGGAGRLGRPAGDGPLRHEDEWISIATLDLSEPATLRGWLIAKDRDSALDWISAKHANDWIGDGKSQTEPDEPFGWGKLRITLRLTPLEPFLVGQPVDKSQKAEPGDPDSVPVALGGIGSGLIGSAVRGALRTRAEQIMRTLAGDEVEQWRSDRERTVRGPDEIDTRDAAAQLFGWTNRQSRIRVHDARASALIPTDYDFLAIDRWTGGGMDRLKYKVSALAPSPGGSLRLTCDLDTEPEGIVGLAVLVLLDLATDDLPLGAMGGRGFGSMRATSMTLAFRGDTPASLIGAAGLAAHSHTWQDVAAADLPPEPARSQYVDAQPEAVRTWLRACIENLVQQGAPV